jgi:hypothetical protein
MKLKGKIEPSKMDIAIEGNCNPLGEEWRIFGVVHGKTSLAERVPISKSCQVHILCNGG